MGRTAALALSVVDADAHAGLPTRTTLRRWVLRALEGDAQITLVFVGAQAGRKLNREYRGRDYATNVLTFAYDSNEPVPAHRAAPPSIVADVVLCMPILRREAHAQGKSLRAHLAHLVVHGVLHAQGYDHERDRDARRMQALEIRLLAGLRIADPYSPLPKKAPPGTQPRTPPRKKQGR
jgi:probable rRNA maturation factor